MMPSGRRNVDDMFEDMLRTYYELYGTDYILHIAISVIHVLRILYMPYVLVICNMEIHW